MRSPEKRRSRVTGLDGIRGLAILLVIFTHLDLPPSVLANWPAWALKVLAQGPLGVTLFFVLSGYVITRSLRVEEQTYGAFSLKAFYIRRALRIAVPLLVFLLGVRLCSSWRGLTITSGELVSPLSFFTNYELFFPAHTTDYPLIAHLWSLCVEEQFSNILWPTLLLMGWTASRHVAVLIICTVPVLRVATFYILPGWREIIPHLTHARADSLMWGALAALVVDDKEGARAPPSSSCLSSWRVSNVLSTNRQPVPGESLTPLSTYTLQATRSRADVLPS